MQAVRRMGVLIFVLLIGIFIGTLGWQSAILIILPLFLLWFMAWDEKKYKNFTYKQKKSREQHYVYRK